MPISVCYHRVQLCCKTAYFQYKWHLIAVTNHFRYFAWNCCCCIRDYTCKPPLGRRAAADVVGFIVATGKCHGKAEVNVQTRAADAPADAADSVKLGRQTGELKQNYHGAHQLTLITSSENLRSTKHFGKICSPHSVAGHCNAVHV